MVSKRTGDLFGPRERGCVGTEMLVECLGAVSCAGPQGVGQSCGGPGSSVNRQPPGCISRQDEKLGRRSDGRVMIFSKSLPKVRRREGGGAWRGVDLGCRWRWRGRFFFESFAVAVVRSVVY